MWYPEWLQKLSFKVSELDVASFPGRWRKVVKSRVDPVYPGGLAELGFIDDVETEY